MPTITLTVGPRTKSATISTPDLVRVAAAFKAQYGAELTDQQAFDIWAAGALHTLQDITRVTELAAAYVADDAAFVPVVIT